MVRRRINSGEKVNGAGRIKEFRVKGSKYNKYCWTLEMKMVECAEGGDFERIWVWKVRWFVKGGRGEENPKSG